MQKLLLYSILDNKDNLQHFMRCLGIVNLYNERWASMKQVKNMLMIWSFIILILVGCTDENTNSFQADKNLIENEENITSTPEQPKKNQTSSKKDASETTDNIAESEIPPEFDYDPELLAYISIQDGFHIADYGKSVGTNYSYEVFNMRTGDGTDEEEVLYWEIVVMQEDNMIMVIRVEDDEHGDAFPTPSGMVIETDVNFDGNNDILIGLGHFGNQGAVLYKCYLSTDQGFLHCPSFSEILNPSVDYENQVVRSQWRDSATSHGWSIFEYHKDEFIETERLIEKLMNDDEAVEQIWSWRDEVFLEGEWQIREYFTQKDFDSKTIQNKLYGADSYWGLDQPKWIFSIQ